MTNQAHPHVELGNGPESTQSFSTDRLADRWYSPLLEGTQPDLWLIQKALGVDTRRSSALLGAAWVHRLCTAFGTQSSRQNRVAAMLVAEMCSRDPSLPLPDSWSKHLRKPSTKTAISELFRSALTQSQEQLDVLVVSLTHPDHGLKDAPISGTSIFLKLGVALAGIASQIEPAKLDSLNHLAVVLGMEIDRSGGTLTQEIRDRTLATLHPCTPPIDTGSSASLASMVPCLQHHKHPAFHNTLERVLTAIRSSAIAPMNHYSWSPVVVQHTASLVDTRETDLLKILGPFTREVNGPLLQAFASLTKNSSASLSAALSSLHDSGGKRLRPLLLLLAGGRGTIGSGMA